MQWTRTTYLPGFSYSEPVTATGRKVCKLAMKFMNVSWIKLALIFAAGAEPASFNLITLYYNKRQI